jgi:hypothetical protein
MPMLTISLHGRELQRLPLTQTRTTIGKPGVAVNSVEIPRNCKDFEVLVGEVDTPSRVTLRRTA